MARKKVLVEAGGLVSAETKEYVAKTQPTVDTSGVPELSEDLKQYARMTVRKEFNENFSKWAVMEPEDATDEFIEETKQDFEAAIDETRKRMFTLADKERALKSAELLKELNATAFRWTNAQWKGVVMFDKVISDIITKLNETEDELKVDYSTLMYLYAAMREPTGVGLEEAKQMAIWENCNIETDEPLEEDSPVTYSGINEAIQNNIQWLSSNDKKLNILKERVNFAYAGIKMNLKISELEEFLEFYDAINARAIENNPDVQQATGGQ